MISEETLCKISSELDGLTEEQFVHEVCHMFMVLMVSGGVSDCIYGIPESGSTIHYNAGTICKDAEDIKTVH